jgi:hypothetical protein
VTLYETFVTPQTKLVDGNTHQNQMVQALKKRGWNSYLCQKAWYYDHVIIRRLVRWLRMSNQRYDPESRTFTIDVFWHEPEDEGGLVTRVFDYALPAWADVISFYIIKRDSEPYLHRILHPPAPLDCTLPPEIVKLVEQEIIKARDDKDYRMARLAEIILTERGTVSGMYQATKDFLANGGETR